MGIKRKTIGTRLNTTYSFTQHMALVDKLLK